MRLLDLPNDVLELVVGATADPALGMTCTRLYGIAESLKKRDVYREYGAQVLDAFTQAFHEPIPYLDSSGPLGKTWQMMVKMFAYDVGFFTADNIGRLDRGRQLTNACLAQGCSQLKSGIWKRVLGNPWGESIYASNVQHLHVRYTTKLLPMTYRVILNLRIENLMSLSPIRFRILPSEGIKQCFVGFPPFSFDNRAPLQFQEQADQLKQDYLNYKPINVCLGYINVSGEPEDSLKPVVFEIEETGSMIKRDILLNYIMFQPLSEVEYLNEIYLPSQLNNGISTWYLVPDTIEPTYALREAFDTIRRAKGVSSTSFVPDPE
ncbi:hypothetical protein TRVA0_008S00298 [Trichomonascus vanleenenianus]|uniref:uncharacterized protein n=1 Tax=Trichomonascus vanleenenianus TaxID=2268995 RepID=UPI003ECA5F92